MTTRTQPKPPTLPTVVTAHEVEQAITDTLKPRLEYYCPQLNYPPPKGWSYTALFDKWPEDQLPCINIVIPSTTDEISKYGGAYTVRWQVAVEAVCSASTEELARKMAFEFAGLIRATLVQLPSLGGLAEATDWVGERYTSLPVIDRRSLATAAVDFHIQVCNVVSTLELPYMPEGPLPTPAAIVVEADTEVEPTFPKPEPDGPRPDVRVKIEEVN